MTSFTFAKDLTLPMEQSNVVFEATPESACSCLSALTRLVTEPSCWNTSYTPLNNDDDDKSAGGKRRVQRKAPRLVVGVFLAALGLTVLGLYLKMGLLTENGLNTTRRIDYGSDELTSSALVKNESVPDYIRPPGSEYLKCSRLFDDAAYITELSRNRLTLDGGGDKDDDLSMSCEAIRRRNYFPTHSASEDEARFPLAEARLVFRDYLLVEMELAAGYAPQNWYCFVVDDHSDSRFQQRMSKLADCLPNVFLAERRLRVDSSGHNYATGYLTCMNQLLRDGRSWEYVSLLQNHDISTKTNAEAVQIFRWLGGANDVEMRMPPGGRYDTELDWSFKGLNIFVNDTRNKLPSADGFEPLLLIGKGYSECSISRAMALFMVKTLNLTEFLKRVESSNFGGDEIFIPTLNSADALDAPGGYTRACLHPGAGHITRWSFWNYGDEENCPSGYRRHAICVIGVEELATTMEHSIHLFANKLLPEFDWAALVCWYEHLHNRARGDLLPHALRQDVYENLPQVRYHRAKQAARQRGEPFDRDHFNCTGPDVKL